jgi:hypothetical protein
MSTDEKTFRLLGIHDSRINKPCFWWESNHPSKKLKPSPIRKFLRTFINFEGPIPHSRVYRMSSSESEALKVQLKDYLERGWIRPSNSEFASGVIFAIKPGINKLRMCTDYRKLNTYTQKRFCPSKYRQYT